MAREKKAEKKNPLVKFLILHIVALIILAGGLLMLMRYKQTDLPKTVYIVRHAEKLTGEGAGRDPDLTKAGHARAKLLAVRLEDKHIYHIYASDTRRTKQTALPLAKALGLEIEIYDPRDLPSLAARIKKHKASVLVVGHSNTIRETVLALGATLEDAPVNEAGEYDRLYMVNQKGDEVTASLSRFGRRYKKPKVKE